MSTDAQRQQTTAVPRIGYRCPNCGVIQHRKTLHWECIEPIQLADGATTPQWFVCDQITDHDCPECGAPADYPCNADTEGEPRRSCHDARLPVERHA